MSTSTPGDGVRIGRLFEALYGQYVWGLQRGHGSFFTMEIGEPRLLVRDPILSNSQDERVVDTLRRRRVSIVGSSHLWVQHGAWAAHSASEIATNITEDQGLVNKVFKDIDGQILQNVSYSDVDQTLSLSFDLNAVIRLSPSRELGDRWTLYGRVGFVSCDESGKLILSEST